MVCKTTVIAGERYRVAPMAKQRIWLFCLLAAIITGGSLFDLLRDSEHWPFSPYSMYSSLVTSPTLTTLRMYGVTEGESQTEFPLSDNRYLQPFDNSRFPSAIDDIIRDPKRRYLLDDAVRDCLLRYEALRRAGLHNGPPLQAIRLYRVFWALDSRARNVDQPDRKDFIVEVR
jgi:hypothetical protein